MGCSYRWPRVDLVSAIFMAVAVSCFIYAFHGQVFCFVGGVIESLTLIGGFNNVWICYEPSGRFLGSVSDSQLAALHKSGMLKEETLLKLPSWRKPMSLAQVRIQKPELARYLPAQASPPPKTPTSVSE